MIRNFILRSAYDDLDISIVEVRPSGTVRAVLQIAHGMCGSKERFFPFMEFMADNGVACVANDHRGHGKSIKSEDDLGFMYDGGGKALVEDLKMVSSWIDTVYPGIPHHIAGHSMGSLAVRSMLKDGSDGMDGVILCGSPGYNPLSPAGFRICSLMSAAGFERLRPKLVRIITSDIYNRDFADEGPEAWTCSDPAVRKAFADDPIHNFRFTINGSEALLWLMIQAYGRLGWNVTDPDLPILFLSGMDDPCMRGDAGLAKAACIMHEAGYRNVNIKKYPAMRHEILNEIGKERVWQDILDFVV